jgi:hypothetical protein
MQAISQKSEEAEWSKLLDHTLLAFSENSFGEGSALLIDTMTACYFWTRKRPRMTMMEPPSNASAPTPIAGSISGTAKANAAWLAINVTASTARRLRAEFFIEESPRFLDFEALTIYITAAMRVKPNIHRPRVTVIALLAISLRRTSPGYPFLQDLRPSAKTGKTDGAVAPSNPLLPPLEFWGKRMARHLDRQE